MNRSEAGGMLNGAFTVELRTKRKIDMNMKSKRAAEAIFKKEDKKAAMSEYERRLQAVQDKSARLRELRLAKEASDCAAAAEVAAKESATKKKPNFKSRKKIAAEDGRGD